MLTTSVENLVKDARERLRRGTVTPQEVEDLADAVDELQEQVGELREKLADAEGWPNEEIVKFLVMTIRVVVGGGMPLTRERLREATGAFGLDGDDFDEFWPAGVKVEPAVAAGGKKG
jgi:hypothetical protein